ncbi:MAG: Spx/MgsR family RNA polymerase-binding regulatory protein [Fibrobacterales bacterium]
MAIKAYTYNKCGTCRKAVKFAEANGLEVTEVPIREKAPTKKELKQMLKIYEGEIKKLFNTSGVVYKAENWKDKIKDITVAEAIDALAADGNLVKRPFVISGDKGSVGFKEEIWQELYL